MCVCTLILSVSMPVLAMRIFTFSSLFGWFTPIFLSSRKPADAAEGGVNTSLPSANQSPPLAPPLTFVQVGVDEAAAQLLDDVDGLQVARALEPHHGVHGELGEVRLVVREQLGGQRGAGDVQQVVLEQRRVGAAGRTTSSRPEQRLATTTKHKQQESRETPGG